MAALNSVPLPLGDPIARQKRSQYKANQSDPQEGLLGEVWTDYLSGQAELLEKMPVRLFNVTIVTSGASKGATDMTDGNLTTGLYRLTYSLRVTVNEIGSTVQTNLDWQDKGVTRTKASALVVGDAVTNYDSDTVLIYADALAPVRYDVVVASLGTLRYDLDVILEEVKA